MITYYADSVAFDNFRTELYRTEQEALAAFLNNAFSEEEKPLTKPYCVGVDAFVIDISICPTSLTYTNGDAYDEEVLLDEIKMFIEERFGNKCENVFFNCLQIGARQGDAWARVDGDDDAGEQLLNDFFEKHGNDEYLFKSV